MIFLDEYKNFGLHIYFDNSENSKKWIVAESDGLLVDYTQEAIVSINLNKPSLIKYFRKNGWNPTDLRRLEVENGLELVDEIWFKYEGKT